MKCFKYLDEITVSFSIALMTAGCASTPDTDPPDDSAAVVSPAQSTAPPDDSAPVVSTTQAAGNSPTYKSTVALAQTDIECKRMQITGTHMWKKVCTNSAEREYLAKRTEEFVRRLDRMRSR